MHESEHWSTDHTLAMLRRAQDDEAAYLMCRQAFTPAELRGMAAALDLPDIDSLRELSLRVTMAARGLHYTEAVLLQGWAAMYDQSPLSAAREYHTRKQRNPHQE